MSWIIRVGSTGFGRSRNADVITSSKCRITSTPCHTVAQLSCVPNADKTTFGKAIKVAPQFLLDRFFKYSSRLGEKAKEFAKNLGTSIIVVKNAGHINQEAGYTKFELLLDMMKKDMR